MKKIRLLTIFVLAICLVLSLLGCSKASEENGTNENSTMTDPVASAEASQALDSWLTENFNNAENYTVTVSIPEGATGASWVNLDSIAQTPFWDWLDDRLYESDGELTIRVSRPDEAAAFDDGEWVEYVQVSSLGLNCYYPGANGAYTMYPITSNEAMGTSKKLGSFSGLLIQNAEFLQAANNTASTGEIDENGVIHVVRQISTRPIFGIMPSERDAELMTGDTVEADIVVTPARETTAASMTVTIPFAEILADISTILYGNVPENPGEYQLRLMITDIGTTPPVDIPSVA